MDGIEGREPYVNRFSTDAIYMPPNTETVVGKDAIRTFVNSFPEIKIHHNVIEIMGSADYAYVRGAFTVTNPTDTLLDKGNFLSIWKKFPDYKWLLTHDIFSSDLPVLLHRKIPTRKNNIIGNSTYKISRSCDKFNDNTDSTKQRKKRNGMKASPQHNMFMLWPGSV